MYRTGPGVAFLKLEAGFFEFALPCCPLPVFLDRFAIWANIAAEDAAGKEEEGEGEGPAHGVVPGAKKRVTNHASTAAELVYDHRGGWFHWGARRRARRVATLVAAEEGRAGRATAHREDAGSRSDDASPASRKGAGRDRDDRDADGAAAAGAGLPGAVPSAFTVPVVAVSRVAFGDPSPALEKELGDL
eukprot:tig00021070_g17892.t1